jgi:hypothetical protein
MALDKNLFRNWIDGDSFSARDYVYERDSIIDYVNGLPTVATIITETDAIYYRKTDLDDGQLDNRYYTQTELDTGQLDNRYYTENEIDGFLSPINTSITTLEGGQPQSVGVGSNPHFAEVTVDELTFRDNGNTETIDFADAVTLSNTQTHLDNTTIHFLKTDVSKGDVGLGNVDNTSDVNKPVSTLQAQAIATKQDTLVSGTNIKTVNNATILEAGNLDLIPANEKGANNGVATLDAGGKVPAGQLPSFVDDLEEYANLAGFPTTGVSDKIYVALDTGKIYRWSGSQYVEIAANEVNSVNNKTGVVVLDKTDIGLGNVTNEAQVTSVAGTAPIVSTGGTTPAISIDAATDEAAGSMSATDKAKLDNLTAATVEFDEPSFTGFLDTEPATTNVQAALAVFDTHQHTVADITDLDASTVTYDNDGQNLVATDVQAAINEIDNLVEEGLTQIVVVSYQITNLDDGAGGFVYKRNDETNITGVKNGPKFVFELPTGIEYSTGSNRLATKIDASDGVLKRLYYGADSELNEPSNNTFEIEFPFELNDVVYAKLYQSLATVAFEIADGSVTEGKIANGAVTTNKLANFSVQLGKIQQLPTKTLLGNNTIDTSGVKALTVAETKTMLALDQVDNTTDLNKPISSNTQTALDAKADKTNVLELDNTTSFTPSADFHPATKKYTDDGLLLKADKTNVLELDNTNSFTPTSNFHPATKKYVDDEIGSLQIGIDNLDDIGDVTITNVQDGEALVYDSVSGDWINSQVSGVQNIDAGSSTTVFSVADINIDGGNA